MVCFALSNKRHCEIVFSHFGVTKLGQICPQDVRDRFPTLLEPFAYNTLVPRSNFSEEAFDFSQQVTNHVPIPAQVQIFSGFLLGEEKNRMIVGHLAFIRCTAWVYGKENVKPPESLYSNSPLLDCRFVILGARIEGLMPLAKFGIKSPVPAELVVYVTFLNRNSECFIGKQFGGGVLLPSDEGFNDLLRMWSQPVIQSVEFLSLKLLLSDWEESLDSWRKEHTGIGDSSECKDTSATCSCKCICYRGDCQEN